MHLSYGHFERVVLAGAACFSMTYAAVVARPLVL